MLATLVASTVALWIMSTIRHAIGREEHRDDRAVREQLEKAA